MENIIECKTFSSKYGEVDYFEEDGKVYLRGTHVCKILNVPYPAVNIRSYCKDAIKRRIQTSKGKKEALFIGVEGLNALIKKSKQEYKEEFGNEVKEIMEEETTMKTNNPLDFINEIVDKSKTEFQKEKVENSEEKEVKEVKNNSLVAFRNDAFGGIRVIEIDGNPWFVGKDIAVALGYQDPSSAVSKNVEDKDKTFLLLEQDGSNYKSKTTIINESGLYDLILESKLPKAKAFRHWVTDEVLPSLTRTGSYSIYSNETNDINYRSVNSYTADELRKLADLRDKEVALREELHIVEAKIRNLSEDKPANFQNDNRPFSIFDSIFCRRILSSPHARASVSSIAKNYNLTGSDLNALLVEYNIQHKEGAVWVINDEYKDKGYSETVNRDEYTFMVWTKEGQIFLYQILREHGILPMIERT